MNWFTSELHHLRQSVDWDNGYRNREPGSTVHEGHPAEGKSAGEVCDAKRGTRGLFEQYREGK